MNTDHQVFMKDLISNYGRLGELFTYIYPWLVKLTIPDKKFVIFALARTGSKLLGDLMKCHPDVYCDKEILKTTNLLLPERYILARAALQRKSVYGFHLKVQQLLSVKRMDGIRYFLDLPSKGWKIVYMKRDNLLHATISILVAKQTGNWHQTARKPFDAILPVYINCEKLLGALRWRVCMAQHERVILADFPHLPILYEEDLLKAENYQVTINKVFNYLDITPVPVKTQFVKTSAENLSDSVRNYDEVVSGLMKTEYAKYLE